MTENPARHEVVDRRDALKVLAAATGAVTIASLPTRWVKPALHVGAIPAHAQVSCTGLTITVNSLNESNNARVGNSSPVAPVAQYGDTLELYGGSLQTTQVAGYSAIWACEGCLWLGFADGVWDIDIPGQPTFQMGDGFDFNLRINLSTGEFVTVDSDNPAGCDFPTGT